MKLDLKRRRGLASSSRVPVSSLLVCTKIAMPFSSRYIEGHGGCPILTFLQRLQQAHVVHVGFTKHGMFVKMHYSSREACSTSNGRILVLVDLVAFSEATTTPLILPKINASTWLRKKNCIILTWLVLRTSAAQTTFGFLHLMLALQG